MPPGESNLTVPPSGGPDGAPALLAWCDDQDVTLAVDGGDLLLDGPEDLLTDAIVKRLKVHKAALIALVAPPRRLRPPATACRICGGDRWWVRPRGGWVCGWCHPPAPGTPTYPQSRWVPARSGGGTPGGAT